MTPQIIVALIWISVIIISLIVEALTVDMVSLWFAISGLVCLLLDIIPDLPYWVTPVVFVIVSVALMLAFRPLAKRLKSERKLQGNDAESLIGKHYPLIKTIAPNLPGELKVDSVIYTAKACDERETIDADTEVRIERIQGNTLFVRKYSD